MPLLLRSNTITAIASSKSCNSVVVSKPKLSAALAQVTHTSAAHNFGDKVGAVARGQAANKLVGRNIVKQFIKAPLKAGHLLADLEVEGTFQVFKNQLQEIEEMEPTQCTSDTTMSEDSSQNAAKPPTANTSQHTSSNNNSDNNTTGNNSTHSRDDETAGSQANKRHKKSSLLDVEAMHAA